MTFSGADLYSTVITKAAALGFSLIQNHGFVDWNKRIGHAAMARFLAQNGYRINADIAEQEQIILQVSSGQMLCEAFTKWLHSRATAMQNPSNS